MITILIVIIIILLIFGVIWYIYSSKKNEAILNKQLPILHKNDIFIDNKYLGNIDNDVLEINNDILKNKIILNNTSQPQSLDKDVLLFNPLNIKNDESINLMNGYPQLKKGENAYAPEGNIYNSTDVSAPFAPPIGIYKESNKDMIDYDERNVYQSMSRNDPMRPIIGEIHRKQFVDPYLREELNTTEQKEWWGNGEY
jgi:cbb3-type cytochrome oxidase subunit 3